MQAPLNSEQRHISARVHTHDRCPWKDALGMPPILNTSSITYLPLGFRSAMKGVRSDTLWKSSMVSLMPTECAMAMRWRTAFVEPPRIMVSTCTAKRYVRHFRVVLRAPRYNEKNQCNLTIAFSNAERVIMSRGRMFFSSRLNSGIPCHASPSSPYCVRLVISDSEIAGRHKGSTHEVNDEDLG